MTPRTWLWAAPAAVALAIAWPDRPAVALPWAGPAQAAGFALLALALELAWRRNRIGTPVYRRHLAIFALLALFGALPVGRPCHLPGWAGGLACWLAGLAGMVLGLAGSCLPFVTSRRLAGLGWRRGRLQRPRPEAPLVLVADPHWSMELTGLAAATAAHPEADWLFLGDVFDVWVGVPGMATPLERAFLDWVAQRRRAGCWVGFWLGNREYFLDPLADRFDLMGEGIGGALPAEGLAWEHGDLVNTADWRYRIWNLVSRSGPVWLLARLLPRSTARALADRLQRALHTTNRAYKVAFPRTAFRAAVAEHPGAVFVTGHFHTHETEAGGIALPWAHEGRFMVWRDGRVAPLEP